MEYIHEIEHADIVHRCFRCGYCKFPEDYVDFNCPSYRAFGWDTYSPGGRMWLIRAWLGGEIPSSPHFAEILYSCAACDNCKEQCVFPKFKDYLPEIFQEAKAELVNEGKIPPAVRDYFKSIMVHGNPFKLPQEERGKWAEGTGLEDFSGQEYLFYIGCVGSYDEVGQKMARSVGKLLVDAGLSVGVLGSRETCDGNEVKVLGETGLFTQLAEENIMEFLRMDVKKIITLDPHALNTFKRDYPRLRGNFEVFHFSEIVAELIKDNKITLSELRAKVTYHDPCYLGRHNQIFNAPREILSSIPGLEMAEMRRNKGGAFCCGGGGGNFFTDIIGPGEDSPSRVRIREALETGAEIIAVACPQCLKMLNDAVKSEGLEDRLEVLDLAALINRVRLIGQ
jgi:Fe-S oxidoreductase